MNDLNTTYPIIRLRPNRDPRSLRFGAPWAYSDMLVLDRRARAIPAGSIVQLDEPDGTPLGLGAFNATSKITFRMMERDVTARIDADWFAARLRHALALRETIYDAPYYRLIHAEADGLPGLIVDRFGDVLALQPNAAWAEAHLEALTEALIEVTGAQAIVKNASGRARKLEGLDEVSSVVHGELDGPLDVPMNGAIYRADLIGGQKTGIFYDQRPNHAFAARLARGRDMLDVFAHVGGFALAALAGGATTALAIDGSAPALELALEGARVSVDEGRFTTQKGDAFEAMTGLGTEARKFGIVVCDPPAFAPNKGALDAGLRAYSRVAKLAAPLVAPGGYLVLCSCSHAVDWEHFRSACLRGIGKAGRLAQIIHTGSAGPDHPTHAHLAETSYLKALFLRLD